MKVLYYDCFCGISGDMNLAALIDLGVDKNYLLNEISKLNLEKEYEIQIEKGLKNGISGTRVDVILKDHPKYKMNQYSQSQNESIGLNQHNTNAIIHIQDENHDYEHTHNLEHAHDHEHAHNHEHAHDHEDWHNHEHAHDHEHTHNHEHPHDHTRETHNKNSSTHEHHHRNLENIKSIIYNSSLKDNIKQLSLDIFMKVAQAEALVHNKSLNEVHFHEVGAIDSIIDIVGAAVCLDYLNVDKVLSSPVQVGGGFVKCAHGIIPVPAPATVEILKNIPIKSGIVQFETTTPTGAAILAANVEEFVDKVDFSIEQIGYGLGHRDLEIPNVLRVFLGNMEDIVEGKEEVEEQYIIETNLDDMNPELFEYVEEKLFANGALDVYKTAIVMKKGRPATKLSILTTLKNERNILDVIFKETTSLGVRKYQVEKRMLERKMEQIDTIYGKVNVKNAYYQGELVKYKAEYEDCKRLALTNSISIKDIYKEVSKVYENK